jgi:hypothetical protein
MSNSNDDISIEELFKVLDSAFTSNNPAVKKALKNFLMIAAIVHAEDSNPVEGPMQKLLRKIDDLERQIRALEATRTYRGGTAYPPTTVYPGTTWVYSGGAVGGSLSNNSVDSVQDWLGTPLGGYITNSVSTTSASTSEVKTSAADIIAQLESFVELENESKRLEKYFKIDAK